MADPARHARDSKPFVWLGLALGVFALGWFAFAFWLVARYGSGEVDFGWESRRIGNAWVITSVDPAGPATILRTGDRLVAINGNASVARHGPSIAHASIPASGQYRIKVARAGTQLEWWVEARTRAGWGGIKRSGPLLFHSLVCFVVAMLMLFSPADPAARMLYLRNWSYAIALSASALAPFAGSLGGFGRWAYLLLTGIVLLYLPAGYHFFTRFAAAGPVGLVWRVPLWAFYAVYALLTARFLWLGHVELPTWDGMVRIWPDHVDGLAFEDSAYWPIYTLFIAAVTIASAMVLVRNYFHLADADQRRRIVWVVSGYLASYAATVWVGLTGIASGKQNPASVDMVLAAEVWSVLVPVSLGYAVLRHKVFGISLVLRKSLQYILALQVLRVAVAIPALLLAWSLWQKRDLLTRLLVGNGDYWTLVWLVLAAAGLKWSYPLQEWLDQRFFRQAYDLEAVLQKLLAKIKAAESPSQLTEVAAREINSTLHPSELHILLLDPGTGDLAAVYSSNNKLAGYRVRTTVGLVRSLEQAPQPQSVSGAFLRQLSDFEAEGLERLGIEMLAPVKGEGDRLIALLLLGPKENEEPYGKRDRQLLDAMAAEVGLGYQRAWLREEMAGKPEGGGDKRTLNLMRECPECGRCLDQTQVACPEDGQLAVFTLPVDRAIEGKYRLEQRLGAGGMGAVYLATDIHLQRRVALKVMLTDLFGHKEALARFDREARASARLDHPNIVRVFDYGAIGTMGAYLVMEYAQGRTLRRMLNERKWLTPEQAAPLFEQLLDGIAAAHAKGIVHRDLKPENLLVMSGPSGELLKILDFGLAKMKLMDLAAAEKLSVRGVTMGTLGYMSPEQVAGQEVDERCDVFATGVLVLETLSGSLPSPELRPEDLLRATLANPLSRQPAPEAVVDALAAVLRKAIAPEPGHRHGSAAELRAELVPVLRQIVPQGQSVRAAGRN